MPVCVGNKGPVIPDVVVLELYFHDFDRLSLQDLLRVMPGGLFTDGIVNLFTGGGLYYASRCCGLCVDF